MAIQWLDFTPGFMGHLERLGVGIAAAGCRAVDDASLVEGPIHLGDADIWGAPIVVGAITYLTSRCRFHTAAIGLYCSVAEGVQIGATRHPTDFVTSCPPERPRTLPRRARYAYRRRCDRAYVPGAISLVGEYARFDGRARLAA